MNDDFQSKAQRGFYQPTLVLGSPPFRGRVARVQMVKFWNGNSVAKLMPQARRRAYSIIAKDGSLNLFGLDHVLSLG